MSLCQGNHQTVLRRPLAEKNSKIRGFNTTMKGRIVTCNTNSTGQENDKNMTTKHHHSVKKTQTASVANRNRRERTRVKGVNDCFGKLKQYVPNMKTKTSRVETLRGAIDYIKTLKELLGDKIYESSVRSMDDSSTISDISGSSYANTSRECVSDLYEMELHPMVYQLPQMISCHPLSNYPLHLPQVLSLPPNQDRTVFSTQQLPSIPSIFSHSIPQIGCITSRINSAI